jgi:hypothetical protein
MVPIHIYAWLVNIGRKKNENELLILSASQRHTKFGRSSWRVHTSTNAFRKTSEKLVIFVSCGLFNLLLLIVLGFQGRFIRLVTHGTCLRSMTKTHCFYILWSFSCSIAYSFEDPWWFIRHVRLGTCLRDMTKKLSLSRFMTVFTTVLGVPRQLQVLWDLVHVWESRPKTHHFRVLWPITLVIPMVLRF